MVSRKRVVSAGMEPPFDPAGVPGVADRYTVLAPSDNWMDTVDEATMAGGVSAFAAGPHDPIAGLRQFD